MFELLCWAVLMAGFAWLLPWRYRLIGVLGLVGLACLWVYALTVEPSGYGSAAVALIVGPVVHGFSVLLRWFLIDFGRNESRGGFK